MNKIGIIGAGLIGASWSAIFASKGYEVYVYDNDKQVFENFNERVEGFLNELKFIDVEIDLNKSITLIFVHIAIKICLHIKITIDLHSKTVDMEHLKIF